MARKQAGAAPSAATDAATKGYVDAALGSPVQQYAVGRYVGAYQAFDSTHDNFPLPSGRLVAVPFLVSETTPFDRIAVTVGTAGQAGSVIRMGLYTSSRLMPTSLVFDAGTVAADSTGQKVVTISQTLAPGLYWLVAVSNDASGTLRVRGTSSGSGAIRWFNIGHTAADWFETQCSWYFTGYTATSALPSTASLTGQTPGNGQSNDLLHILMRAA
jgi:hypothetical protein